MKANNQQKKKKGKPNANRTHGYKMMINITKKTEDEKVVVYHKLADKVGFYHKLAEN